VILGHAGDLARRLAPGVGRAQPDHRRGELIARYQGTALLANTFRDLSLMDREAARVSRWIDSV